MQKQPATNQIYPAGNTFTELVNQREDSFAYCRVILPPHRLQAMGDISLGFLLLQSLQMARGNNTLMHLIHFR